MSDQDQIRRLMALWAQRNDDKDGKGWSELFTEDGTFINARRIEHRGRAAIRKNLEDRTAANPTDRHTTHMLSESVIDIDGDQARAECDYTCWVRVGDAPYHILTIGRCIGHFVRENGGWLFREFDNRAYVHSWLKWAT